MSHYQDEYYGYCREYSRDDIPLTVRRGSWTPHSSDPNAPPLPPKDYPDSLQEVGEDDSNSGHERSHGVMTSGYDDENNAFYDRSLSRERFFDEPYSSDPYSSQAYAEARAGSHNGRHYDDRYDHELPPVPHQKSSSYAKRMRRKMKWRKQPWFVWFISTVQIAVFMAELAKMGILTGSPIETQPTFNPMIGPSPYVMINMGVRFTPCMHFIAGVTNDSTIQFPCPNSTTTATNVCSLSELCGMGGIPEPSTKESPPNQWWRFITPIFIHAGFIHIGFNLLLQLKLGAELEKEIGIVRFILVYFASGIAGFILAGNFSPDGIASTGASGSLFGVIALDLLDLLFNWKLYATPVKNLLMHIVEIIISFALGLLPGIDNFSHIGGFAMGILTGTALLRSPLKIRLKVAGPQIPDSGGKLQVMQIDWRGPKDHFKNRSRWWYGWILVRVAAVVIALVYFIMLIRLFEDGGGHCSWCKYLACLPVHDWCGSGNLVPTSQ